MSKLIRRNSQPTNGPRIVSARATPWLLLFLLAAGLATAQTEDNASAARGIVDLIGQFEGERDPKCYATASRLEDFMYGTPLSTEARFVKNDLQTALASSVWRRASEIAAQRERDEIDVETLETTLNEFPTVRRGLSGEWVVTAAGGEAIMIPARDVKQYASVAFGLRAILAARQEAMLDTRELPLPMGDEATGLFKDVLDAYALATLQLADRAARQADRAEIDGATLEAAWVLVVGEPEPVESEVAPTAFAPAAGELVTLRAIIEQKLAAYAEYNHITMPVFMRNLQVYFARFRWPADPERGEAFRTAFTSTAVAFTGDLYLRAERYATAAGRRAIGLEDVHRAVQDFLPHEVNRFEDVIYFPRLDHQRQVVIEAYDLDAYRDSGIHWLHLSLAIEDPDFPGRLELDPFAAELVVEAGAQFGVLALRLAGAAAESSDAAALDVGHLGAAVAEIQARINAEAAVAAEPIVDARLPSASATEASIDGVFFSDVTAASGIDFEHRSADWLARRIRTHTAPRDGVAQLAIPPAFGGGGAAARDMDGDGDTDLLLLGGRGNALWLNDGAGRFRDATHDAGLEWTRDADGLPGEPRQPIVTDFDNDGRPDILITYVDDPIRLYRNLGGGRFADVTRTSGLGGDGLVAGPATAFDYDGDGLVDVYVGMFGDYPRGVLPTLSRHDDNALPNRLFKNRGGLRFQDVSAGSGTADTGWTQSVGHTDFDNDGRQDLIVGNDFGVNAYYRNLGDGTFKDVAAELGTDKPSYTMNVGITDLNRDGFPDLYISNIVTFDKDQSYVLPEAETRMRFDPDTMSTMRVVEANDLFVSVVKDGRLESYAQSGVMGRGASSTGWAWDADFFDVDNDGDDDLYCVNGMNEYAVYSDIGPYKTGGAGDRLVMPVSDRASNVLFLNDGGRMHNVSGRSGADLLGNSRSVAYLDLEGDGDLDMVINNFHEPAVVYRNNAEQLGNHWLTVRLIGSPAKGVSRDAVGARIIVSTRNHNRLWREVHSTTGYLSVHPVVQHFGLGRDTEANVTVEWPNGSREVFEDLAVDRNYTIVQGQGIDAPEGSAQE